MIIEGICNLFFGLIVGIVNLLPANFAIPDWFLAFADLISKALFFFPSDVLFTCFGFIIAHQKEKRKGL